MSKRVGALLLIVIMVGVAAPAVAGGSVWFEGAVNQGHPIRPKTLWLSADGTLEVFHMHWSSWNGSVADGRGKAEYHGCTPSCGAAPIHHAAVTVRLSDIRDCRGQDYYNHVTLYKHAGQIPLRYQHWAPC